MRSGLVWELGVMEMAVEETEVCLAFPGEPVG